jgi:hypothetical protein
MTVFIIRSYGHWRHQGSSQQNCNQITRH